MDLTWDAVPGAQSYVVGVEDNTQAIEYKYYTETNAYSIKDDNLAGSTKVYRVIAFADKYQGKDEAEKAKNAIDSGKGSEPSDLLSVTFPDKPADKPGTPTDFKATDTTYNSTKFSWSAPAKAQSYLLYKGETAIAYKETLNHTFEDDTVEDSTVGFFLQAFNEKYTGATEADKIKGAQDGGKGGDKTPELEVTFPKKPEDPAVTPTNVTKGEVTKDSATINWTRGSANGKATVIEYADGISVGRDYTEGTTYTLTDAIFGEPMAGKTISFKLSEYNDTYPGATSKNKADNAENSKKGSPQTQALEVDIPSELKRLRKARL